MLPIPSEIATLLKSKMMIGENRPTASLKIDGAPANGTTILGYDTQLYFREGDGNCWLGGSFVKRKDGKTLVIYNNSVDYGIYFSVINDEIRLFDTENAVKAGEYHSGFVIPQETAGMGLSRLQRLTDGTILLYVLDVGKFVSVGNHITPKIRIYKSENGLGTDFEYYSTCGLTAYQESELLLVTSDNSGTMWPRGGAIIGVPIMLDSGRIVLPWEAAGRSAGMYSAYSTFASYVSYSDDNGINWITICLNQSFTSGAYDCSFRGIMKFGQMLYIEFQGWQVFTRSLVFCSHDEGETWYEGVALNELRLDEGGFWGKDGYNYWFYQSTPGGQCGALLYRRPDTDIVDINGSDLFDLSKWENIPLGDRNSCTWIPVLWVTGENRLAILAQDIYLGGVNKIFISGVERMAVSIPIKSTTVDRTKGSASQATVVINNKNGIYAPDSEGVWNHVVWPNKKIEISLGYGARQQKVFTGMIDDVTMRSYPSEISFVARDMSKLALDQMVRMIFQGNTIYSITYQWQTPEYIFRDLAIRAGWSDGFIYTEETGITLEEIVFAQEQYADCFQRLTELVGFEWFCDEFGNIYFRKAVETAPTASYIFTEGVDIFSLDYTISDSEIYNNVAAISTDETGKTICAVQDCYLSHYGLPTQKTLLIPIQGPATQEQLAQYALFAAQATWPKPRQVNFVAVGVPYLQIGDCIQVIESSSTISEIYRIFELVHKMDSEGSPVFSTTIKCYHYAAT